MFVLIILLIKIIGHLNIDFDQILISLYLLLNLIAEMIDHCNINTVTSLLLKSL